FLAMFVSPVRGFSGVVRARNLTPATGNSDTKSDTRQDQQGFAQMRITRKWRNEKGLRVTSQALQAEVYGNRTHRQLCSNRPLVLKTRAPTRGANTSRRQE